MQNRLLKTRMKVIGLIMHEFIQFLLFVIYVLALLNLFRLKKSTKDGKHLIILLYLGANNLQPQNAEACSDLEAYIPEPNVFLL